MNEIDYFIPINLGNQTNIAPVMDVLESTQASMESNLLEMLRAELEYPVCTRIMAGQRTAHHCPNGHPCCLYCPERVSSCPLCRCEET